MPPRKPITWDVESILKTVLRGNVAASLNVFSNNAKKVTMSFIPIGIFCPFQEKDTYLFWYVLFMRGRLGAS